MFSSSSFFASVLLFFSEQGVRERRQGRGREEAARGARGDVVVDGAAEGDGERSTGSEQDRRRQRLRTASEMASLGAEHGSGGAGGRSGLLGSMMAAMDSGRCGLGLGSSGDWDRWLQRRKPVLG